MTINNCFREGGMSVYESGTEYFREGRRVNAEFRLAMEHELSVYVNDVLAMRLVCSPELLPELVLGRLLTEGLIKSAEDVEYLYICPQGTRAMVTLPHAPAPESAVAKTPTCCTGNQVFSSAAEAAPAPVKPIPWREEWVYALAQRFEEGMPTYAETRGTHSCFLASRGRLLYSCEDIGRHNALDKLIGCALRDGVDLTQTMVYSSGRIPTDMAEKVIRAGIPVLISKTVPTDRAAELARRCRLTLICTAQSRHMVVYSDGMALCGERQASA